jgi:hypothetical protein
MGKMYDFIAADLSENTVSPFTANRNIFFQMNEEDI